MGNQQSTNTPNSNAAPSEEHTALNKEADTDSTCIVSPSKPSDSFIQKREANTPNTGKSAKEADHGERKKKKAVKARDKSTNGRKSVQSQSSGRSSKSTSKSSSRGKTKKEEQIDSVELEFRRAFRGEGREKARFVSNVQEKADVPPSTTDSSVKFESMQTVVNVIIPHHRTFKKKNRSKHDPWRRYGALKKLHQIGGWAFHPKEKNRSSRRSRGGAAKTKQLKYYEIKKGEAFYQPPPNNQPITKLETVMVKDKRRRNSK